LLVLWLGLLSQGAQAADPTVTSPSGNLAVTVRVDNDGRPEYRIDRNRRPLLEWSRLGFILADARKLERNFRIVGTTERAFDDTWEQPWGERRYVRDHGKEMRVQMHDVDGRDLYVVFPRVRRRRGVAL
jgi:alpha-glucosidase